MGGVILGIVTLALYYPLSARWEQFWNQQAFNTQITLATDSPSDLFTVIIVTADQVTE